jgi:hypothetical protein
MILGLLTYLLVLLGCHMVAEGYCLSVLMCCLQGSLPYTGAGCHLVYLDSLLPATMTPLAKLLIQLSLALTLQLSAGAAMARLLPASLLTKRMSFYSSHLLLYVMLAHTAPLIYFGVQSVVSTRLEADVRLWWVVGGGACGRGRGCALGHGAQPARRGVRTVLLAAC